MDVDLDKIFDGPYLFGLEAQGKIEIVEDMLAKGKSWDEIGEQIGWDSKTAKIHYERYQKGQKL